MSAVQHKYNGILLIDKPSGMTSHDVVQRIRRTVGQKRIGHTGTLDPNAEGLLMLCLGNATKIVQFLTGADKKYEAVIFLGKSSVTFDEEGVDHNQSGSNVPDLSPEELNQLLAIFRGRIRQSVPIYSAVHVDGQRLYKRARKGESVDLPIREVEIKEITLIGFDKPYLRIRIRCSSGTYVRSIAHDIGEKLGCGAYLSSLRRTSIGKHSINDAVSLEHVQQLYENKRLQEHLLDVGQVLEFGAITVSDTFRPQVLNGSGLRKDSVLNFEGSFVEGDEIFLKGSDGCVLAVGHARVAATHLASAKCDNLFSYIRVLN
ncbi:MAG: tRNA pseudouridine(55) synthase TruB [Candidatus Zixiibacteriota bacterium]|nr:MAG: tRNA pseudouridine(55) synthase TruB [candidate division Zixibacteria bacterium]